ncbi:MULTISPECIES: NAD(P)-dependent oxidoreductase [unclassified Pseudofrankia]|uniref:NAD(P)-dependent oxidoreductase n=1 Tax=unclassified Pseudofrankia TaxID=2994372 RepID=UPI0008D9E5BB|nr:MULTISPECIES: NAD(P)-dependent oxidoreductase [unclassified Pseudofrankia]MDT3444523.1 NAD(P)-dependent oxidoreductase [Pseudofrankia sp. BMG5.37]OHV56400.1 6-phosphogluconate dehydrogenase [Pseudofrankia sp. BMG5.36]
MTKLGWLGTGRMGAAMAARLIDAGNDVLIWNRTAAKTAPLVEKGATRVETVADLCAADVVFTMVSTPRDLEEVAAGPGGLLAYEQEPETALKVLVDCSTVSMETSAWVRARAAKAGVAFLAAPVSGNPHVVASGGASIVASGPRDSYDLVAPYLLQIAKVAVWTGEEEQSRLVKLCHNLYLGVMVQALVEVTSLAEKGGTDRAAFLEFLNGTVLGSDWVRKRTKDLVAQDWTPTFTTELLRKDFDLGLGAARALEVPMPVAASVHQLIQSAIGSGLRDADFLSLFVQQARIAGLPTETDQFPTKS